MKNLLRVAVLALLALSLGGPAHAQYVNPYGPASSSTVNMTSTGTPPYPAGYPATSAYPYGYPANAAYPYGYPATSAYPYGYPANAVSPYGYPAGAAAPYANVNPAVGVPRADGSVLLPSGQILYPAGSTVTTGTTSWPYLGTRTTVATPTVVNPNPQTGLELLQYYQMHPRNF